MAAPSTDGERFHVEGNRLVVTSRFDPRLQRESEGELLDTLQGLLEEKADDTILLDLSSRTSFPSMLIGVLVEARQRATEAGKGILVRVRAEHLRSLEWAGMNRIFDRVDNGSGEPDIVEFRGK